MSARPLSLAVLAAVLALGAGAAPVVRVDSWSAVAPGPLDLSSDWRPYPPGAGRFAHPPAIILDEGRPALRLMTSGEAMRIGRSFMLDVRKTPWLVWEWKALVLPTGGDVRDAKRNDQAGRVMVAFEGMKFILYVWDTTAPRGVEVKPDELEIFQRVLIVVRSGTDGLGRWCGERRNVYADYRRAFEEEPRAIKWIGLESHSNDTRSRTSILFRGIHLESG